MKFDPKFAIHHVLYVPYLKCNLISISQLLYFNPSYGVHFFLKYVCCTIPYFEEGGWKSKTCLQGVQFLQDEANRAFAISLAQANRASAVSLDLLHKRIGHALFSMLEKYLGCSNTLNSISNCFVCFQAKQSRACSY